MKLCRMLFVMLLLAGRNGAAQITSAVPEWPAHRWTVGIQLAYYPRVAFAEFPDSQGSDQAVRPWPVMLTLAYRVRQQASIEVGLLLRAAPTYVTSTTSNSGTNTYQTSAFTLMMPIVTRLHLPVLQPGRWQADLEFGIMPVSSRRSEKTTFTDARTGQTSTSGTSASSYSDLHFLAGFGGGYAITPQLSFTADARVTYSPLLSIVGSVLASPGTAPSPFFGALSAGLSYHFGLVLR
jgi:hypothetical protein